jgi:predicted RNA-binding protein with PIN domain
VPDLYLVDGYNLLHAGAAESREELVDRLAEFLAVRGARGVVVFDGAGPERLVGGLEVRFAPHADQLIERLAAERRLEERVAVVSSDTAVRETAGVGVRRISSRNFLAELAEARPRDPARPGGFKVEDALDPETRARLERWRRER